MVQGSSAVHVEVLSDPDKAIAVYGRSRRRQVRMRRRFRASGVAADEPFALERT